MFIIVKCLLATVFNSHYRHLCLTLHPPSHISAIDFFIAPPPDCLCDATYNFHWDAKFNKSHFTGIPTYIYLIKTMDDLLTNQGSLAPNVTEALNMDID